MCSAVIEGNKLSNGVSESKFKWESRVEMLEEELGEAAVIEATRYSVVSEHGSSTNKVHAPAWRLSRFYLHVCKSMSQAKRASAVSAAASGLILVSKSCGNDVPRLTFWLSNSIMLRAIVNQAIGEMPLSDGPHMKTTVGGEGSSGRSSYKRDNVVTLTPHMQSSAANGSGRGSSSRKSKHVLSDQEQGSFSIELWKKAFKDACERLCPIQASGHEYRCLPMLARLVMEQLVDRLDVAMFNAILCESAEEMPTDPVFDPISDPKVLPILYGKSSFRAGSQLKNAEKEDGQEDSAASVTTFPCVATRTVYSPPPVASLAGFIGEVGSQTL
ncbi:unnamed protein product [Camellia sinensis]